MALNIITALTTLCNKIISLNTTKVNTAAVNNICNRWEALTITASPASKWTVNDCSARLVGDRIGIKLQLTRSSSLGGGNITNEDICTLSIKTLGKISNAYATSFCTGEQGTNASFTLSTPTVSGSGTSQTLTTTVRVASTYGTGRYFTMYFPIYTRPNVSYYGI